MRDLQRESVDIVFCCDANCKVGVKVRVTRVKDRATIIIARESGFVRRLRVRNRVRVRVIRVKDRATKKKDRNTQV
jgi:hypothetical protein